MTPQEVPQSREEQNNTPETIELPNQSKIDALKTELSNNSDFLRAIEKYESIKKGGRDNMESSDILIDSLYNEFTSGSKSYRRIVTRLKIELSRSGGYSQPKPIKKEEDGANTQAPGEQENKPTEIKKKGLLDGLFGGNKGDGGKTEIPEQEIDTGKPENITDVETINFEKNPDAIRSRLSNYIPYLNPNDFSGRSSERVRVVKNYVENLIKDLETDTGKKKRYAQFLLEHQDIQNALREIDRLIERIKSRDRNPIDVRVFNIFKGFASERQEIVDGTKTEVDKLFIESNKHLSSNIDEIGSKFTIYLFEEFSTDPVMNRMRGNMQEIFTINIATKSGKNKLDDKIKEYRSLKAGSFIRKGVEKGLEEGEKILDGVVDGIDIYKAQDSEEFLEISEDLFSNDDFREKFQSKYPEIQSLEDFRNKIRESYNLGNEAIHIGLRDRFNDLKGQLGNGLDYMIIGKDENGEPQKVLFDSPEEKDQHLMANMSFIKGLIDDPDGTTVGYLTKRFFGKYLIDYWTIGKFGLDKIGFEKEITQTIFLGIFSFNIIQGWRYSAVGYPIPQINKLPVKEKGAMETPIETYEKQLHEYKANGSTGEHPKVKGIQGEMQSRELVFEELKKRGFNADVVDKWRSKYIFIKSKKIFSTLVFREILNQEKTVTGKLAKPVRFIVRTTSLNVIHHAQNTLGTFKGGSPEYQLNKMIHEGFFRDIWKFAILSDSAKSNYESFFREQLQELEKQKTDTKGLKSDVGRIIGDISEIEKNTKVSSSHPAREYVFEITDRLETLSNEKDLIKIQEGVTELRGEIKEIELLLKTDGTKFEGKLNDLIDEKIREGLKNSDRGNIVKYITLNKAGIIDLYRNLGDSRIETIKSVIDSTVDKKYFDSIRKLMAGGEYTSIRHNLISPDGKINTQFLSSFQDMIKDSTEKSEFIKRHKGSTPSPETPLAPEVETETKATEVETEVKSVEAMKAETIKTLDILERHFIEKGDTKGANAIKGFKQLLGKGEFNPKSTVELHSAIEILFESKGMEKPNIKSIIEKSVEPKVKIPWTRKARGWFRKGIR